MYTLIFAKSPLGWESVATFSLVGETIYFKGHNGNCYSYKRYQQMMLLTHSIWQSSPILPRRWVSPHATKEGKGRDINKRLLRKLTDNEAIHAHTFDALVYERSYPRQSNWYHSNKLNELFKMPPVPSPWALWVMSGRRLKAES